MPEKKGVYILYCLRSDGMLYDGEKLNQPPLAHFIDEPSPDAMTRKYYSRVERGHRNYNDWLMKLGFGYARDCGDAKMKAHPEKYMLHSLPKYYSLWDYVKETFMVNKKTGELVLVDERHDYYLHGHFSGHKNRFRSPAEFLPHLYHLMSAKETANQDDCHCILCAPPEEIQVMAKSLLATQVSGGTGGV